MAPSPATSQTSEMPRVRASVTQRAREGSVLPSRQLRTTPSENPHMRAISVALPTRWISNLMRSEKFPPGTEWVDLEMLMTVTAANESSGVTACAGLRGKFIVNAKGGVTENGIRKILRSPRPRIFAHAPSDAIAPLDAMACRKFHQRQRGAAPTRAAVTGPAGQHRFPSGFSRQGHCMSQFALLGKRRFAPFFWTQALGAFNDNAFRNRSE